MSAGDRDDWGGPSLSIQLRSAGEAERQITEIFVHSVLGDKGTREVISTRAPRSEGATTRSFERWRFAGLDVAIVLATWLTQGDSVLEANIQLTSLKALGPALPDDVVKIFVNACKAVHAKVPLTVAVIGEEVGVGSALLDLWEQGLKLREGDPGTLWPDEGGGLSWYPGPPISLKDL